jgi:hypothetical protein
MNTPNCKTCKYFYITWDKNFPYGCKKMKFKSKKLPSLEVKTISGLNCLVYEPKENK